ncbi:RagB/SusD family nutrient uptake outer membrane protein [Flavobacterium sp. MFBS3-15]|uniref:RagB/SusD family nutrient uptake outer membrane protein n=1 Tax=Flavobacterium sp. MFBS3-15 TaxID=2989816 RepID=UPI00223696F0|nr:RagB/SusD family nutrient uptake outer membrane protein [Flavobacterium sp. MFBS3-15]MCW4468209.1 RagB/SusD family nutrient uptake outer membrane protein [Flavobacterium sp. MFBS3-15]
MKKLKFNFLYLLGLTLVFSSCTSDLDVQPEDDDISTADDFYKQPGAYKQALAGVYGNLSLTGTGGAGSSFLQGVDAGTSQFGRCLWYMQELTTDEAIWSYENDPGVRELQRNTWNAENPLILGMFSRTMVEVALANEFLKQSTPAKLSSRNISSEEAAEIEVYRNEVKVLRAMAYYYMLDMFRKAPFITENDPVNFRGPEYNAQQLYDFIESELVAALPNLKAARSNEYGRLDQGMANMVLAKLYLNAEVYIGTPKYAECAAKCQEVINSGYVLNANYLNNFKADNHTSSENIFTLQSDGTLTQNYGPTTTMVNGEVGSLELNGVSLGTSAAGWSGALRTRKQFFQKFGALGNVDSDSRNTFLAHPDRELDITDIANKNQGYVLAKWSNITSAGVAGPNSTFVDTDFVLFRLADAYLMYAECAARGAAGTNPAVALDYVNDLRERANGNASENISQSELTPEFILDERARELHWEGHRRQDLIRFGKFTGGSYNWEWKGNSAGGVAIANHLRIFPLPTASIAANPNLTQNTGY